MTNYVEVGVLGVVEFGLVIAEDMIVAVTQDLAPAEFCVDVTNNMLVAIS